jgi:phage gpG-like protein
MTPLQMALILDHVATKLEHSGHEIIEPVAVMLEKSAKDAIGTYKFGWPSLAESTLARKAADTPLYETGELQRSIEHKIEGDHGYVGTNDEKAAWQEFGTSKIPPRPFLGGALAHDGDKIPEIVHLALRKIFE